MTEETTEAQTVTEHADEPAHLCSSHYGIQGVGTFRCLLAAPHPRYQHYAAAPDSRRDGWSWTDEQAVTLGRHRINDVVRYLGTDPRYLGQQGRVLRADYDRSIPLVVELPGGPRNIGICFNDEQVELVTAAD